jgi:hypothetical protein
MAEALRAYLINPVQARKPFENAWMTAKSLLLAGHRLTLEVKPETRNSEQNALLHALLTEIAKTREWAGAKRDAETWKRLMTAAWLRAHGESVEILPAIDGHGVDVVFRRTSSLTKSECADLITFIQAWEAMQ